MMRKSGVSPARLASKTDRETPRRSACGHRPARQLRKLAAAARIACAVLSGGLGAPDSPLHSCVPAVLAAAGAALVLGAGGLNRVRMSKPSGKAGVAQPAPAKTAILKIIGGANLGHP